MANLQTILTSYMTPAVNIVMILIGVGVILWMASKLFGEARDVKPSAILFEGIGLLIVIEVVIGVARKLFNV